MPSGPKKRKAAKKKQVKVSDSSSSSTTHSHHGENDGGELSSPAVQDQQNHQLLFTDKEVEKHEDGLCQNESVSIRTNKKTENEEGCNLEIDKESKLRKSHDGSSSSGSHSSDDESRVFEKNVVVLESTRVLDIVQPIEPLPEKKVHEVEDSTRVDSVKPVDSLLKYQVLEELHEKPAVASTVPKTASWKGCCGILELFSSSGR